MLNIKIPGCKNLKVDKLVFALNGTIACNGRLIAGVKEAINRLAADFEIYVLTTDEKEKAAEILRDLEVELVVIAQNESSRSKAEFVEKLGRKSVISVGNGNNDVQMLKNAELSIVVLGAEGTVSAAVKAASLVSRDIVESLEIIASPERIKSTLQK